MRNFSKFQLISPAIPRSSEVRKRYSGWRLGPFTSSFALSGKLTS